VNFPESRHAILAGRQQCGTHLPVTLYTGAGATPAMAELTRDVLITCDPAMLLPPPWRNPRERTSELRLKSVVAKPLPHFSWLLIPRRMENLRIMAEILRSMAIPFVSLRCALCLDRRIGC